MKGYTRRKRVEHIFNNQKFKSGDEVRAAEQLQANLDLILCFEYEPKHEDLVGFQSRRSISLISRSREQTVLFFILKLRDLDSGQGMLSSTQD